jgi:hypothetical protein
VLADLPQDQAAGATFLVDPGGWLRAAHPPGARDDLLAAIRGIDAHPIKQASGDPHEHHH